jgi:hypothetical protein
MRRSMRTGEVLNLVDFKIKSPDPYSFSLASRGQSEFVNLGSVTRIRWVEANNDYVVTLETGEVIQGRIGTITFSGMETATPNRSVTVNLRRVARIHVISGDKLRTCPSCGFQDHSAFPFCPVCGAEMVMGPGEEEEDGKEPDDPVHRYRLDSRKPASDVKQAP